MTKPSPLDGDDAGELDQLLARGRLSGAQYDELEQRVLDRVAPEAASPRWPWLVPAVALAAGLVLWLTTTPRTQDPAPAAPRGEFREKSGGGHPLGAVTLGCGAEARHSCKLGETLLFSVSGGTVPVFLLAYAERADDPTAARIWYFPHADQAAPRVDARGGTTVLSEGIRLGAPHARGRYRVKVWLSESALTRAGVGALDERNAQSIQLDIID